MLMRVLLLKQSVVTNSWNIRLRNGISALPGWEEFVPNWPKDYLQALNWNYPRGYGDFEFIFCNSFQITRDDLFVHMREEFTDAWMSPLEIPSPQTFRYVWRTNFPQLKIPCHNTLGVCKTCSDLKQEIWRLPARSLEQQNFKGAFKAHLYQVKRESHAQIERDQSAAAFPQDSWTITTDFMQDLFQPYLHHRPKSWFVFF
jgi:hypothetical protein